MFVLKVLPLLIFVLQLASVVHLFIVNRKAHAHVPVVFIELNIIVIINIVILLIIYFFIYKLKPEGYWALPLFVTFLFVIVLLYFYLRMLF